MVDYEKGLPSRKARITAATCAMRRDTLWKYTRFRTFEVYLAPQADRPLLAKQSVGGEREWGKLSRTTLKPREGDQAFSEKPWTMLSEWY